MSLIRSYNRYKDRWWALPLIITPVFYPLVNLANTFTIISGQEVMLYYLPMALFTTMMTFFGWAALPGVIIALT